MIALAAAQGCDSFDATPAIATMRPAAIEAHLRFLADDALLGRETGGEGAVVAAEYIATQFAASGLEPAGNNASYLQSVPIIAAMPAARLALRARGGAALSPRADVDYVAWTSLPVDSAATAGELVFVGHGISAPDWGRDDYKGADVADAVVLILGSEPRGAARPRGDTLIYGGGGRSSAPGGLAPRGEGRVLRTSGVRCRAWLGSIPSRCGRRQTVPG